MFIVFPPSHVLTTGEQEARTERYSAQCHHAEAAYLSFLKAQGTLDDGDSAEYRQKKSYYEKQIGDWCVLTAQHLAAEAGAKSANFARWTVIAAFVSMVFLIITLLQASKMLKITRDASSNEIRAYLGVDGHPQINMVDIEGHSVPKLVFRVKNYGSTPARNCSVAFLTSFIDPFGKEVMGLETEEPGEIGTMFPGRDWAFKCEYVSFLRARNKFSYMKFLGVIFYQDVYGGDRQTTFLFHSSELQRETVYLDPVGAGHDYT